MSRAISPSQAGDEVERAGEEVEADDGDDVEDLAVADACVAQALEFKTKYGSLTNRQFVTRIYTDVLGRAADPSGVNYWTGKLDRREKTRGQVMVGFSESNEYKRKQAENTDVSVAYIFMMGRAPTAAEITDWVTRQKAGTSTVGLTQELLDSDLYAARVAT